MPQLQQYLQYADTPNKNNYKLVCQMCQQLPISIMLFAVSTGYHLKFIHVLTLKSVLKGWFTKNMIQYDNSSCYCYHIVMWLEKTNKKRQLPCIMSVTVTIFAVAVMSCGSLSSVWPVHSVQMVS